MGNGDGALQAYQRAEEAGLTRAFACQNYAMAHLVKGDVASARESLQDVAEELLGPHMIVQRKALLAVCAILEGKDHAAEMSELHNTLDACPDFSVRESPLRFLRVGLRRKIPQNAVVEAVFEAIAGPCSRPGP
jgi:hypothetical protein